MYHNFTATMQAIKKAIVLSFELLFICIFGALLAVFLLLYYICDAAVRFPSKS
jgi:hypothetical protein